jgi:hypothetical protein
MAKTQLEEPSFAYAVTRDPASGHVAITTRENFGRWRVEDTGVELLRDVTERFAIQDDDPLSCVTEITKVSAARKGDWDVRVEATGRLSATKDTWLLSGTIRVFDRGQLAFEKSYDSPVKRDLV